MAQSEFDFSKNVGAIECSGGIDGVPLVHSSLASPLTQYGTYGRTFYWPTCSVRSTMLATIAAAVDGGVWIGTPDTYSVRVEAVLRIDDNGDGESSSGICVKTGVFGDSPNLARLTGYSLVAGKWAWGSTSAGSYGSLTLLMTSEDPALGGTSHRAVTIKSYTRDTWVRVRMDVLPSPGMDTIKIYSAPTQPLANPTWTLEHTEYVYDTDAWYTNWGDPSSNKVGFFSHNSIRVGGQTKAHVDNFVAMREAVG